MILLGKILTKRWYNYFFK